MVFTFDVHFRVFFDPGAKFLNKGILADVFDDFIIITDLCGFVFIIYPIEPWITCCLMSINLLWYFHNVIFNMPNTVLHTY